MADPRLAAVLTRIEAALAALEAKSRDDSLTRRHAALQAAAAETLAGLDRLLEPTP